MVDEPTGLNVSEPSRDLSGRCLLVTAGPNRAWIDRIKFITTPSSGKMGLAIAEEAQSRGAVVLLVIGPTCSPPPVFRETVSTDTFDDMYREVMRLIEEYPVDAFVSAASVLDYVPSTRYHEKLRSGQDGLQIRLSKTPKIIDEVRARRERMFIVGFKLEAGLSNHELHRLAREYIDRGVCDLVVANDASRQGSAFGSDTNEVLIIDDSTLESLPLMIKREVARRVINRIALALSTSGPVGI